MVSAAPSRPLHLAPRPRVRRPSVTASLMTAIHRSPESDVSMHAHLPLKPTVSLPATCFEFSSPGRRRATSLKPAQKARMHVVEHPRASSAPPNATAEGDVVIPGTLNELEPIAEASLEYEVRPRGSAADILGTLNASLVASLRVRRSVLMDGRKADVILRLEFYATFSRAESQLQGGLQQPDQGQTHRG
jgi:hypothetical protein